MKLTEADIKSQVKDYLAIQGIFSYPLTQGIGSFRGLPDRVIHYKGQVIYLECKRPKRGLSPSQLSFYLQCKRDGILYKVIHSVEELENLLRWVE